MRHRYSSDIGRMFDFSKANYAVPDLPSPAPRVPTACAPHPGRIKGLGDAWRRAAREDRS